MKCRKETFNVDIKKKECIDKFFQKHCTSTLKQLKFLVATVGLKRRGKSDYLIIKAYYIFQITYNIALNCKTLTW